MARPSTVAGEANTPPLLAYRRLAAPSTLTADSKNRIILLNYGLCRDAAGRPGKDGTATGLGEKHMSSTWLDQDYYLQEELSLVQAANPDSDITTTQKLLTALSESGKSVEQHFIETGWKQGLNPSASFDVSYYLEQLADKTGLTPSAAKMLLEASGMDPVTHYMLIGASLGINPSEYFDTSYYLAQKAAFLNKEGFMGKTDWTSDDALHLMQVTGLNPLSDYQMAGWSQDLSPIKGFTNATIYEKIAAGSSLTADQIPLLLALAGSDPLDYLLTYGLPSSSSSSSTSSSSSSSSSTSSTSSTASSSTSSTSSSSSVSSLSAYVDSDGTLHLTGSGWSDPYVHLGTGPTVTDGSTSVTIKDASGSTYSGSLTHIDLTGFTVGTHVIGSSLADKIIGGSGNDVIDGGAGTDTLTGGGGQDTFVFNAITSSTNAKVITDFVGGSSGDILQFDVSTYTDYHTGNASIVNATTAKAATSWNSNAVVVDTEANIDTLNVSAATGHHAVLAIASDTGAIMYDADGDFSSGVIIIGSLTPAEVAHIAANNIHFV